MEQPIITVVVPVYNAERYLNACIESITAQTFSDWEAILIDDGATDSSPAILDAWEQRDTRIHVVHQRNSGVSRARNAGIERAKGRYLMFVDSDDLLLPTCMEKLLHAIEESGADMALCGFTRFRDGWEQTALPCTEPLEIWDGIGEILRVYGSTRTHMFGISIWAKLYRIELLMEHGTRFDPAISYEEDCNFIADCFGYVRRVAAVGESLYRYRQMDVSLSKGYRKDTFRFLIHGYGRRCGLLRAHGREDLLPVQESILLLVVKNTSVKISRSQMTRGEKREAYAEMLRYPEVTDAADRADTSRSPRLTRMIVSAVRSRSAKRLARVMRLWRIADRLSALKRKIVR